MGYYQEEWRKKMSEDIQLDTNLREATSALYRLGMDKKSAGKVLRDTPRNNLYNFSTKSKLGFDSSEENVGDI